MNRKLIEKVTDLNRKSSKFIGSKTGGCRKLIGHASEIAETPKGHSLAKVQLGRYVQVISLDISTLSEPLRWAFTLIGGMPPCLKSSMCEFGRVDTVLLGVFTHTPPEGGDTNRSKPHQQNRSQQFKPKPKEANPINRPESNS